MSRAFVKDDDGGMGNEDLPDRLISEHPNLVTPEGWHTGLTRVEDIVIGVSVSVVVAMLFWPRRLEPLVAQLVAGLSAAAGTLLTASVQRVAPPAWRDVRRDVTIAEARTRAALAEFLVQQRASPQAVEPWIARFGVASHTRSASDAIMRLDTLSGGSEETVECLLSPVLRSTAATMVAELARGVGPPEALTAAALAEDTHDAAWGAIAAGATSPVPVVRDLLTRDWLIAVTHMLETRP